MFDAVALRKLKRAGLDRAAEDLWALRRNSVRLLLQPDQNLRPGTSKLGGTPDLPPTVVWPEHNGVSMALLSQINLADVSPYDKDHLLPEKGMLYFFCDVSFEWKRNVQLGLGYKVIYHPGDNSTIRPAPVPGKLHPDTHPEKSCAFGFSTVETLPSDQSVFCKPFALSMDEQDAFAVLREALREDQKDSAEAQRMLGHADFYQNDCHRIAAQAGDKSGGEESIDTLARRHQLLLQLFDNKFAWWGGVCHFLFLISDEDLRARRFDRTFLVIEYD